MKHSININSTILFYILQLKTYKRTTYQDVFYAFMMNINNNVGISTTATTTTSSTTTTTNGLHKRPLAIGYKQQGPILVTLPQQQQQQSTTKIEEENNQPFRGGISEVKVAMTITTATT